MQLIRQLSILAAVLSAGACVTEAPDPGPAGSLTLALAQTTASGDIYRLRDAVLTISSDAHGAESYTASPDDTLFQTELPPGDYMLILESGWHLERTRDGMTQVVEATLASDNPQAFSIEVDQVTTLELRFEVVDEGPVVLGDGSLQVALAVEVVEDADQDPGPCAPRLVISEVDYDQPSTDDGEFVEVYNAGACPATTAGLALVLHNGGASGETAYATFDLALAAESIPPGGFLVVGDADVIAALPAAALALPLGSASLQNGDPDGVSLERDGVILDAMSYGGVIDGVTEGAGSPTDGGAGSLSRCPAGSDSDDNATDFALVETVTPGADNAC